MRWNDASKLHKWDIVTVKANNVDMEVVEVEVITSMHKVNVLLLDGNWYDHRDLK